MTVVVLTGGVGGAKLVDGLTRILQPGEVSAIVNTGDDFEHLGLRISPDIDSVFYLLSGNSDPVRGWGVADESWEFMRTLKKWGGPDWFNLGDRDLAMHVLRTDALRMGQRLTDFTAAMVAQAGLTLRLLPMSEDPVHTMLETDAGTLAFQNYFVERQCKPRVSGIHFAGADASTPTTEALAALRDPALQAIIIAPSNPYLSIDPILAVPSMREAIAKAKAPTVAVSPIVGGQAVKGPTAKLMDELGIAVTHASIARHYAGLLDGLLIDAEDEEAQRICDGLTVRTTDTMMSDSDDRRRVAHAVLELAMTIA